MHAKISPIRRPRWVAAHHFRGIERRKIFLDDIDRHSFLDRLGTILKDTKTPCFAWALIPNHAHLLLRISQAALCFTADRKPICPARRKDCDRVWAQVDGIKHINISIPVP